MGNAKKPGSDDGGKGATAAGMIDEQIGTRLKTYYDSIVDEGTPAHLLDLLERLHEAELKAKNTD